MKIANILTTYFV